MVVKTIIRSAYYFFFLAGISYWIQENEEKLQTASSLKQCPIMTIILVMPIYICFLEK
jgi:hypothetical protein